MHLSYKPTSYLIILFWYGVHPGQFSRLKKFRALVVPGGGLCKGIIIQGIMMPMWVLPNGQSFLRRNGGITGAYLYAPRKNNIIYVHTYRWSCCTMCTLEMCYGLIPPFWSNIVNPSIPSKPRWRTKFGWNLMKYVFYVTTSQRGGEGQGDTHTYVSTDRHTNLIGKTGRPTEIDTTHQIELGFSWRRIQSEFWCEK